MRHLTATALAIGIGAIFTWIASTSLEGYEVRHNARAEAQIERAAPNVAANSPTDHQSGQWMF